MENKMEKRYGLFTAICLVVGTVIGSGVFFKAQAILQKTEGNVPLGILAWLIGGAIMICCVLAFSAMAQKYEKVNGIVDYAEALVGERYGYYIGWFLTTTYYPTMTCVLAWVSARYTMVFLTSCWPNIPLLIPAAQGGCVVGPECLALTLFYLCMSYAINTLSPILAGKFQTSTTVIKFIPLTLMAVVGIIAGLFSPSKLLVSNFAAASISGTGLGHPLLSSVCATAFAYEGWIIATSINSELKDAKRNLPIALVVGGIIIMATYTLYYLGVAGGATVEVLMNEGATTAFTNLFGGFFGNILNLFIVISCLGTTNGLMLGCSRGMYALAARGKGPKSNLFVQVDKASNLPTNSGVICLVFCAIWFLYFYLSNLAGMWNSWTIFTGTPYENVIMLFDPSELPILTTYAMYLPIFVQWMRKAEDQSVMRRYVIPALAMAGSCFMVYATVVGHRWGNLWYVLVFAVIMLIGSRFEKAKN